MIMQIEKSVVDKCCLVPSHLRGYEGLYPHAPREAATAWFRQAGYGLFIHFGLYSLLGRGEWVQLKERIPVGEYARLKDRFTADGFDADAIARLAVDAGMKYVNITTRHHESFCLFRTEYTDFNSCNSPAKRDLVGELAEACRRHRLGLFLYYSHGRDWKHPHAPNNDQWGGEARPDYSPPEPSYAYGRDHHLSRYVEFLQRQVAELLTQYGSTAGLWLDGIMVPLSDRRQSPCPQSPCNRRNAPAWRVQELYDRVHDRQPHLLVSYKQGLLGTEDFFAPEHQAVAAVAGKPVEVCTTLCPGSWGYLEAARRRHLTPADVLRQLNAARANQANLLLNTGLMPDGSLDPEDVETLRRVGDLLRKNIAYYERSAP